LKSSKARETDGEERKREITMLKSTANQKRGTHTHTPTQLRISAPTHRLRGKQIQGELQQQPVWMSERGRVKGGLRVIHSSALLDRRQEQKLFSPHHSPTPLQPKRISGERYDYEHRKGEGE